jgi:hypothetical protein
MELERECRNCKQRWDGGLHDEECPKCKSKNNRITWTDEFYDYGDDGEIFEEEDIEGGDDD